MTTAASSLPYPQHPKIVTYVISLFAILSILHAVLFFIQPQLFAITPISTIIKIKPLLNLYWIFLFLYGLYTGRSWVQNLILILVSLGLIISISLFFLASHSLPLSNIISIVFSVIALILILLLYAKSSRAWFKACADIRIQRHQQGIKNKVKPWLITISVLYAIFEILLIVAVVTINLTHSRAQIIKLAHDPKIAKAICADYFKNPHALPLLKKNAITPQRCEKLLSTELSQCANHFFQKIPEKMKAKDFAFWSHKVGYCGGQAFIKKYINK